MLYPQQNENRIAQKLDGVWDFCIDPKDLGEAQGYSKGIPKTRVMAVPASWNEQSSDLYNYQKTGWYETTFAVPYAGNDQRVTIRFGAVTFAAKVWLNGEFLGENHDAYLPFEFDITDKLQATNTLVLRVQGYPTGEHEKAIGIGDFYEFAGIHRSVHVTVTNTCRIEDFVVKTALDGTVTVDAKLTDGDELVIAAGGASTTATVSAGKSYGAIKIENVVLWSPDNPKLYDLDLKLLKGGEVKDSYTLPIGVRTVEVKGRHVHLNGKHTFLKGFGKHEDFPGLGRGTSECITIQDFNLMKWCGANSFRTTHYPYSEELLSLADRMGFVVIDETASVSFTQPAFQSKSCAKHAVGIMERLIQRDKNHPCVISWSIGNECDTTHPDSEAFFLPVIEACRKADDRPITYVAWTIPEKDTVYKHVDIVGLNRYFGWYKYPAEYCSALKEGDIEGGVVELRKCLDAFAKLFDQPIFLTEFGADTIAGFHSMHCTQFSEEFQERFLSRYLDVVEEKGEFVCGAHIWNFADFLTRQGVTRVGGNKKGVFTRTREPKKAVFKVRSRWTGMEGDGLFGRDEVPDA